MSTITRVYSPAIAARLLMGTSLATASLVALGTPALSQTELPAVQVQGAGAGDYNAQQPGLAKLTEPLLDTPVSVDTITQQVMQDRGETTLNDALRNAPGITLGAGEFLWQGNNPYIRGFSARTDMFADGMRDFGDYYRDPFNLEKVEVLEGPDSILFGRGSTGGVINQVTKTPTLTDITSASISAGTNDAKRATGRFRYANRRPRRSGSAARQSDGQRQRRGRARRRGLPALWLGAQPGAGPGHADTPHSGLYAPKRKRRARLWHSMVLGKPAPVERSNFYGYDSDYLKNDNDIVTGKIEHDLTTP